MRQKLLSQLERYRIADSGGCAVAPMRLVKALSESGICLPDRVYVVRSRKPATSN